MTVAGRVAAGSGLLILVLAAALAYHVAQASRLTAASRDLARKEFRAALLAEEQRRLLEEIDVTARKVQVSGDYALKLGTLSMDMAKSLDQLGRLRLSGTVGIEAQRLADGWGALPLDELAAAAPFWPAARGEDPLPALGTRLAELRDQAARVHLAAQRAIEEEVAAAAARRRQAERISWLVVAAALAVGLGVLALTVRSINGPLKRLTEGTRAVAAGDFGHRIEAGGGELGRLAGDFNRMTARLAELERVKKELLSRVSHELRTPLVAMHETNQLLLDGLPGPLTAKQRRLLELNREGGGRLAGMIGKLLDASSLEAGAVHYRFERQDLGELARSAAAAFEGRARERGLAIVCELPPAPVVARCDGERVLQALENLLDNALQHSPTGRRVRLRLSRLDAPPPGVPGRWRDAAARGPAGVAMLRVEDRGPGVPDEHKERVFETFHRVVRGRRTAADGVGLGLAICREIAAAHHGAVWVEDRPGEGSSFTLMLACEEAGDSSVPAAAGAAHAAGAA